MVRVLITIILLSSIGCVTVRLAQPKSTKAEGVYVHPPGAPFHPTSSPLADQTFENKQNGNTISYLSECQAGGRATSLKNMQRNLLQGVEDLSISFSQYRNFKNQRALHTIAKGQVDGYNARFELILFHKNDCTYVLSYTGLAEEFDENRKEFENFIKEFQAP